MHKLRIKVLALVLALSGIVTATACRQPLKDDSSEVSTTDNTQVETQSDPPTTITTSVDEHEETDTGEFLVGPYLIGPKSDSMTICWESKSARAANVNFQAKGEEQSEFEINAENGPEFEGVPLNMFYLTLDDLTAETEYEYSVDLGDDNVRSGKFKTLPEDPKSLRVAVISDTHKFETRNYFNDFVLREDPDFILHTGDLVEGTGASKEQFDFWFSPEYEFLRNYPVIYALGNHDFGPYFDAYVTKIQGQTYRSDIETGDGSAVGFRCGPIYLNVMDSNLWALFELNEESSGQPASEETHAKVVNALEWLKEDLEHSEAKTAPFRILGLHHPYTDSYTHKYIPEVVEQGGVNLLLSGHDHNYQRFVSVDPDVGARTVYLTQGDGRIGDNKIDYGEPNERLDENWPEKVAAGKADYLMLEANSEELTVTSYGLTDDEESIVETFTLAAEEHKVTIDEVKVSDEAILAGGSLPIEFTATNAGDGLASVTLDLYDNDELVQINLFGDRGKERVIVLNPGESIELATSLEIADAGDHQLKIHEVEQMVEVQDREPTAVFDDLRIFQGTKEKQDIFADHIVAEVKIKNIGSVSGEFEPSLFIDSEAVDSQTLSLDPKEEKILHFEYEFEDQGDYRIQIGVPGVESSDLFGDEVLNLVSDERDQYIMGTITGMPIVKDQSGNGNDGIVHGQPLLVKHGDGQYGLALDGEYDYVEIPDNENYHVDDGLTGMVWADINRVANMSEGENDHNPLMIKGVTTGWGTNYLYRMCLRTTGKLTYGLSFDYHNGEFFWNDFDDEPHGARLNEWTQYTGTFDRASGGDSYQNGLLSGHIDSPDIDSEIINWPGTPMYSGFSYHRHLLPKRDRGKLHTMLDASIGQLRFYDVRLTAEENKEIHDNPDEAGPQSEHLKVWLDYNPDHFDLEGKHITEWVDAFQLSKLKVDAMVTDGAKANVMIEWSDDGETVSETTDPMELKDGVQEIEVEAKGAKARLVTTFESVLDEQTCSKPSIRSYELLNEKDESLSAWKTLAHWRQGSFEGAAGYENLDAFIDHELDFATE